MLRAALSFASLLCLAGCTADTFIGPLSGPLPPADAADPPDGSSAPDTLLVPDGSPSSDAGPDAADAQAAADAPPPPPDACGGGGDLGTCAHSLCAIGAPLASGCDPQGLTSNICPFHPACCASGWTQACVDYALGQGAFACTGCAN